MATLIDMNGVFAPAKSLPEQASAALSVIIWPKLPPPGTAYSDMTDEHHAALIGLFDIIRGDSVAIDRLFSGEQTGDGAVLDG